MYDAKAAWSETKEENREIQAAEIEARAGQWVKEPEHKEGPLYLVMFFQMCAYLKSWAESQDATCEQAKVIREQIQKIEDSYVTAEEPWAKLKEYLVRFSGSQWPRQGVPWRFDLGFRPQPTEIPATLRAAIFALSEATRRKQGYRAPVRIQAARFDPGQKGPATRALFEDWMARYDEDAQYVGWGKAGKSGQQGKSGKQGQKGQKGYGKGHGKRYGKGPKGPGYQ